MEPDWELKDRRIAWMNMNTACSTIIAARIASGLYKPKDNKEAMKELLDAINIEYSAYLSIGTGDVSPSGGEERKPSREKKEKQATIKKAGLFCDICSKEIVAVDVEIKGQPRHFDPEQIVYFSQAEYQKNICWACQHEPTVPNPGDV